MRRLRGAAATRAWGAAAPRFSSVAGAGDGSPPVVRAAQRQVVDSILAGVRADRAHVDLDRVLSVLVDNESGVLNRVCGLLSARGFNIESLTVSPTNVAELSRMTIVIGDAPEEKAAQALKQLNDVVNVWAVVDYTGTNSLQVRGRRRGAGLGGRGWVSCRGRSLAAPLRACCDDRRVCELREHAARACGGVRRERLERRKHSALSCGGNALQCHAARVSGVIQRSRLARQLAM